MLKIIANQNQDALRQSELRLNFDKHKPVAVKNTLLVAYLYIKEYVVVTRPLDRSLCSIGSCCVERLDWNPSNESRKQKVEENYGIDLPSFSKRSLNHYQHKKAIPN